MGAKQSKRSVDISGKEAEGGNEVAAAGAGGEGRVEPIADVDSLKPQLNGDAHAHIQPPAEQNDKEKQLDSGTPENEKDATTEKEIKEDGEKEKEANPVSNGETEQKTENGETTPAAEDGKKPKKEKLKKKWSLRSISFSRKDKPKQEKKNKEEEAKTNGEPEKVPEEAAEATTPEATETSPADTKPETDKEQKTPETPVTEPITNGSSTPESPKAETPADEPAPEVKPDPEPEKLPINGLTLEEKNETPEVVKAEESKPEESTVETTETAPAPEIPVKTEVCVEQMPSIEPTPPPLPANPPPSSVVSFAASTMAPELTDASLANTAPLDLPTDQLIEHVAPALSQLTPNTDSLTETLPPLKETTVDSENIPAVAPTEPQVETVSDSPVDDIPDQPDASSDLIEKISPVDTDVVDPVVISNIDETVTKLESLEITAAPTDKVAQSTIASPDGAGDAPADLPAAPTDETPISPDTSSLSEELPPPPENISSEQLPTLEPPVPVVTDPDCTIEAPTSVTDIQIPPNVETDIKPVETSEVSVLNLEVISNVDKTSGAVTDLPSPVDDLPPPPPPEDMDVEPDVPEVTSDASVTNVAEVTQATSRVIDEIVQEAQNAIMESNHVLENGIPNGVHTEGQNGDVAIENLKNISKDLQESVECNGGDAKAILETAEQHSQELADKMADLIPEVPTVPELKSETAAASEVSSEATN